MDIAAGSRFAVTVSLAIRVSEGVSYQYLKPVEIWIEGLLYHHPHVAKRAMQSSSEIA